MGWCAPYSVRRAAQYHDPASLLSLVGCHMCIVCYALVFHQSAARGVCSAYRMERRKIPLYAPKTRHGVVARSGSRKARRRWKKRKRKRRSCSRAAVTGQSYPPTSRPLIDSSHAHHHPFLCFITQIFTPAPCPSQPFVRAVPNVELTSEHLRNMHQERFATRILTGYRVHGHLRILQGVPVARYIPITGPGDRKPRRQAPAAIRPAAVKGRLRNQH